MKIIVDPHLIYTAGNSIKNNISWIRASKESEWIYFGDIDDINKKLVISTIKNYFDNHILYIVTTRKNSVQTTVEGIETLMNDLLMTDDFIIWDVNFIRAMEFSNVGTMRCGQIKVQI